MDPTFEAVLRSWPLDPWVVVPLLATAAVYVRGWRRSRRHGWSELGAFLGGLTAVSLALASPIEPFSSLLLQVHMLQHLLLMMVAPPLVWLGAPALPLLRGLPLPVRRGWLGPFVRDPFLRRLFDWLTDLPVAWALFVGSTWLWHVPLFFDAALEYPTWHYLEHACFLGTALLFWYPVVQPGPGRPRRSEWLLLPYLFLADVQNTVLSALLTFSGRVIYPHYESVPRLGGITALDDQAAAGVLMWVPGSIAYLVPLVWIGWKLLYGQSAVGSRQSAVSSGRIALPVVGSEAARRRERLDLVRAPLMGRFLRWRGARPALQAVLLLVAALVILDGLLGPPVTAMNLAGVLPWVHWRGLVVLGLLVSGNVFCMACPFLLPRTIARRWLPARKRWPRWLRGKWLAVALLIVFFWSYEAFDLWASPWWTAWIALGYFLAAFAIDGLFEGAAFCKYVCPIGQFHFAGSLLSPLEVKVREPDVCLHCVTKDCIRGNESVPGCELQLFQPRKAGNLDCTFCLDCVHSCPHDNVGILAVTPGAGLLDDRHRSGVGRWSRRTDLAVLILVLVFAAFVNAAGMVAPVVEWQDRLTALLGLSNPLWVVTAGFLVFLLLVPAMLVGGVNALSRWWSGDREKWLTLANRFACSLWPLGFGMWLAHYSFHFFTSADTVVPVVQRLAGDWGFPFIGAPAWGCECCGKAADWLLRLEIVFLDAGLLGSLYLAYRLALERHGRLAAALKAWLPWALLMALLFALGVWLLFQPMEMRGTMAAIRS